ncbi:MAG: NAD-dependent malic enzyme [Gammaproteobacteria bacterium]
MTLKLKFPWDYDAQLPVRLRGYDVVRDPLLNKSSAFTADERLTLGLQGILPTQENNIEEQASRVYPRLQRLQDPLEKYMTLASLQDRNEHLFFRVLTEHLEELMPIVYTPTVGLASSNFSQVFMRGRGLWITPEMRGHIKEVLQAALSQRHVSLLVVTDNEAILGIGDQGAGGMAISVGKLALYTACAGIHPGSVLPVSLDVGTDNEKLLQDKLYLGWKKPRLRGKEYEELVDEFVTTIAECYPGALVQWEDFRKDNALAILDRYREKIPSFNDDIQGTGAVALAGIYSACRIKGEKLSEQRIVISGAGAAGLGIFRQIRAGMELEGLSVAEISQRLAVFDSRGLIVDDREIPDAYKREMAWPAEQAAEFGLADPADRSLMNVVSTYKPTVLLGASGQAGAFNEELVRAMAASVERPVVLPFSNPTAISEAVPEDVMRWTEGRALIATGSPFPPVDYNGSVTEIGQGNNVFIFPGIGLGALLSEAPVISDAMISVSAHALAAAVTDEELQRGLLYPSVSRLREVSAQVALAVMKQAASEGCCAGDDDFEERIANAMWFPKYPEYVAVE